MMRFPAFAASNVSCTSAIFSTDVVVNASDGTSIPPVFFATFFFFPIVNFLSFLQFLKAFFPTVFTESGRDTCCKPVQFSKLCAPSCCKFDGQLTFLSFLQFLKAFLPICFTFLPNVTFLIEVFFSNAPSAIVVTFSFFPCDMIVSGIVTFAFLVFIPLNVTLF